MLLLQRELCRMQLGIVTPKNFEPHTTQLLDVLGRERKVKTSMNREGGTAQKCCMLRSQRVAIKISISTQAIINSD